MTHIFLSWILTPVISGCIAFLLFRSVQLLIFDAPHPIHNAKRYIPGYIFFVTMVLALVTVFKGLKHLNLNINWLEGTAIAAAISIVTSLIGLLLLKNIPTDTQFDDIHQEINLLEKIFGILMIFTACSMAFAHGSNDVANAIGPLAAIYSLVHATNGVASSSPLPSWILGVGAAGIVLGLSTYGYRVIATIGKNITELTPSRGFAAELATACTVVVASASGLPISTTQTLVGGVLGVGLARGIGALDLNVIRNIFLSWVITLPAGAAICIIYFNILKALLPH